MPRHRPSKQDNKRQEQSVRINERIRISELQVIDQNGQNLGKMSNADAKALAYKADLDLVEVAPNSRPPVCRIMDYGKYRYEQALKEKKQRNTSKAGKLKVIRLSPKIDDGDIETKTKHARKFLEQGNKVQLKLRYNGREKAHKDVGLTVIKRILSALEDIGATQKPPKLQGSFLDCIIEPK